MPLPTPHPSNHHHQHNSHRATPSRATPKSHHKPLCRHSPHFQHSSLPSLALSNLAQPYHNLANPPEVPGDSLLPPKYPTGHSHPRSEHTTGTVAPGTTPKTIPTSRIPSPDNSPVTRQHKHHHGSPHQDATALAHHNPSTRPRHHRHKSPLHQWSTSPKAAHHHHCKPWSPNPHKNPSSCIHPKCQSSPNSPRTRSPYEDHYQEPDQCHEPDPADEADPQNPPDEADQQHLPDPVAEDPTTGDHNDDPTPPTNQPADATTNAGTPPWERPHWGRSWGNTPSSQRGYPFRSSTPRAAGHGSQRVGNKLGKYNFKQRSRSGHRPRHPGPQPQRGPGWGIIVERDTAGDTPASTNTATDTKQATAAHSEHQQRSRESPYERWQREHHERAQQDTTQPQAQQGTTQPQQQPSPTATAAPNTQGDTQATKPSSQAETQSDDTWSGPPHFHGTLPPDIDIPTSSGGTNWLPLNNGCWEVVVKPTSVPADTTSSAGLPPLRTVNVGQAGPLATAPIFSGGIRGRLAPLDTPNSWLFTITEAPALDDLEPHSLFVVEGDSFRLELKPQGWLMTVETQAPSTARTIRQAQEHKAKPKAPPAKPKGPPPTQPTPPTQAKQQPAQPGGSDPQKTPPNPSGNPRPAQQVRFAEPDTTEQDTGTKQDTAAQAAHHQRSRESPYERWQKEAKEREQHNQPPKPTQTFTKPGAQPERHPLLDGRPLRGNQPQTPNTATSVPHPQQQQPPPPKPHPFAAVRDGRTIGGGKRRPPTTTTTTTNNLADTSSTPASTTTTTITTKTTAGEHTEGSDHSILMQRSLAGIFHQQTTQHPPPPPQQPPQQLPQPPPPTAVVEMQQHVVNVASTQSDSPPEHGNLNATSRDGGGRSSDPIGTIEAQLSKIARLAQQLPGGGPIQALAESALTDLLLDSQTESQLLRDLEIEQTAEAAGGNHAGEQATAQPLERPTKQARTTTDTPAAAALQRILNKAQMRMASTRDHIYISYYDIQHDIDIVLKWLNDYVHRLETGGRASPASSSHEAAPSGDANTRHAVMEAMPALAGALYGLQQGAGNEHWQQLAEIAMMLSTVLAGGTISHPADVIAENRGILTSNLARARRSNKARGILLELQGIGRLLSGWPACEINTVHAALLVALEEVEEVMQPGPPGENLPLQAPHTGKSAGEAPPTADWWLHDRHHGLGNAPGSNQRSPTEAMESGSEASHRRRRLHATGAAGD